MTLMISPVLSIADEWHLLRSRRTAITETVHVAGFPRDRDRVFPHSAVLVSVPYTSGVVACFLLRDELSNVECMI